MIDIEKYLELIETGFASYTGSGLSSGEEKVLREVLIQFEAQVRVEERKNIPPTTDSPIIARVRHWADRAYAEGDAITVVEEFPKEYYRKDHNVEFEFDDAMVLIIRREKL